MIQIDTLKLAVPLSKCRPEERLFTQSKGYSNRLYCSAPSGFGQIYINTHQKTLVMEMSAKMLKDAYHESINLSNFTQISKTVSDCVSVTDEALYNHAKVLRCDVVNNIDVSDYGCSKREIINTIGLLKSHSDYTLDIYDKTNNNGIVLRGMYSTVRERTIIYDKQLDLNRTKNKKFIQSLNNPDAMKSVFSNVVRIESNIASAKRLKSKLNIPDIYLCSVLSSCESVNYHNITKICNHKLNSIIDLSDYLYNQFNNIFTKNDIRGYIELFKYCNYDSSLVQQTLSIENNWTKQQKYYYWTRQGIKNLFFAAKLKNEMGIVSNGCEIFTKFLSDLRKVA
jgi:hypothetical protein